jgi:hypothetical protein
VRRPPAYEAHGREVVHVIGIARRAYNHVVSEQRGGVQWQGEMSTPVSPSEATKAFTKTKATVPKKHVVVEVKVKDSGDATKPKETCASPQKSQAGVSKAEVSTKTLSMPKPQTRVVFMRDLEAFLKSKGELPRGGGESSVCEREG